MSYLALTACGSEALVGTETETHAAALKAEVAANAADRAVAFAVRSPMLDTSPSGKPNDSFRMRYVTTHLVQPLPVTFQTRGTRLEPRPKQGALQAAIRLPQKAADAFQLADPVSTMELEVTLEGAAGVDGVATRDLLVFPEALGPETALYHSVRSDGLEDFVLVPDEGHSSITYQISLRNVAGLRLVSNTLEFLNESGDPRLRVAPPWVVDSQGSGRWASLSVEGCRYDTSSASPWDRTVVNPGSSSCRVTVAWDGAGLAHPVLVDPTWTLTESLAIERYGHGMSHPFVRAGKWRTMVCGGISPAGGGTFLSSCEERNDSTETFTAAASMITPRAYFVMTSLSETCSLPCGDDVTEVLVAAGGWTSLTPDLYTGTPKIEIWRPGEWWSGTNYPAGNMTVPRIAAAGAASENRKFLITGGFSQSGGTTTVHTSSDVLRFYGTMQAAAAMPQPRAFHTATALRNGTWGGQNQVLVVGGSDVVQGIHNKAIRYNPAVNGWIDSGFHTNLQVQAHTTTEAYSFTENGFRVLVAGGNTATGTSSAVHAYDASGGGWSMNFAHTCTPRAWHTATLQFFTVHWAGGELGPESLINSCSWSPDGTQGFFGLNHQRTHHAAAPVPFGVQGAVIVSGGWRSQTQTVLGSVERGF